ncbi:MAG: signal peptidase I [Alphaproteobacteria bacterium]|nr:signal peptidase I [Alphaproteobacteria bacterium]
MLFAAVIALFIRSFLFEPFNIPSGSMFPTLLVGDYLFVEKYAYGYSKYSFPFGLLSFEGRVMDDKVTRGDVVVFRQPKRPDIDYIKRIVGLPGDTIQVTEGRLYINGKIVPRDLVGTEVYDDEGRPTTYHKYIETLPNGVKHDIYEISDHEALDNTQVYKVPKGYYFAMGDNRDSSLDSRVQSDVGYVPEENLIGRAVIIFFSTKGIGDKCERDGFLSSVRRVGCDVYEGVKQVRYSRMFKRVAGY